tara:strand:- start:177 stop:476 length:300 start_codon:yes stop_codon:yes gene_type:complete
MTNNNNFYFDGAKGVYLEDDIVKFNLINLPTNQIEREEKITLITSFSRFELLVNFLNGELSNMKKELSKNNTNDDNKNKKRELVKKKAKGKIILSQKQN